MGSNGVSNPCYILSTDYASDVGLLSFSAGELVLASCPYSGARKSSSATGSPVTGCS